MLKDEIQNMYNIAMGGFMEAYATTHKRFFTQKEFEQNYAKITNLSHSKSKLDAIARQIEEQNKIQQKKK
jgi:hypothetical protein